MNARRRWEHCVTHRGIEGVSFVAQYLGEPHRRILLIGGAGFDPRATRLLSSMSEDIRARTKAILLRETRPSPDEALLRRAVANRDILATLVADLEEIEVHVFADDNAVIGGRNAVLSVQHIHATDYTDVLVDISALSIGVAFPVIKHFLSLASTCEKSSFNLHVMCWDNPLTDTSIRSTPSDLVGPIHGFRGGSGLDEWSKAALLWMPQLSTGKRAVLGRVFQAIRENQKDTVVCPILPFPSATPRRSDELIQEYAEEFQGAWSVDVRDIVYADEKSPLDVYRTIVRIDDARRRVFEAVGGSQIILSPLGSKALALGTLMAALDRDFTLLYAESIGYTLDGDNCPLESESDELVHIWLYGEAYCGCVTKGESNIEEAT